MTLSPAGSCPPSASEAVASASAAPADERSVLALYRSRPLPVPPRAAGDWPGSQNSERYAWRTPCPDRFADGSWRELTVRAANRLCCIGDGADIRVSVSAARCAGRRGSRRWSLRPFGRPLARCRHGRQPAA